MCILSSTAAVADVIWPKWVDPGVGSPDMPTPGEDMARYAVAAFPDARHHNHTTPQETQRHRISRRNNEGMPPQSWPSPSGAAQKKGKGPPRPHGTPSTAD